MPQAVKYFRDAGSSFTTPSTIYTCPTNTVAQIKLDFRAYGDGVSGQFYATFNTTSTSPTVNFYNLYLAANTGYPDYLNSSIIWDGTKHVINQEARYCPVPLNNYVSNFSNSAHLNLNVARADSTTSYLKTAGPFYMKAGDKFSFVGSTTNSSVKYMYSAVIIEEAV